MKPQIRTVLAELNRAFYQKFAGDFARTRQSWPPGFKLILPYLKQAINVLDLGCGNGRLLLFLAGSGWRGRYLGLDSGGELLTIARANAAPLAGIEARFEQVDLLAAWPAALAEFTPDAVAALAVLHHIPGAVQRRRFLAEAGQALPAGGRLVLSTWQFLTPRLAGHILPWSTAGLADKDVEAGDYLLTWGQGAAGMRYCALIDEAGVRDLAAAAGLAVEASFYADGHEGNLNLYAVLKRT